MPLHTTVGFKRQHIPAALSNQTPSGPTFFILPLLSTANSHSALDLDFSLCFQSPSTTKHTPTHTLQFQLLGFCVQIILRKCTRWAETSTCFSFKRVDSKDLLMGMEVGQAGKKGSPRYKCSKNHGLNIRLRSNCSLSCKLYTFRITSAC